MDVLRAVIVEVIPPSKSYAEAEAEMEELSRLIDTVQGIVVVKIIQKRGRPSANMYLGTGKAQEVAQIARKLQADVVVINSRLRTTQLTNLQKVMHCEVWDRIDLILKIFERHAHSQEAQIQVALAQMKNEFPRLYGRGKGMSQIVGGKKGYTRGPGEKYLEQRKRYLRGRIEFLEEKVVLMEANKARQRQARKRKNFLNLALVGYTNSGKSSLLVALTRKKNVYVADELFATLDTRIGSFYLPAIEKKVVLSDTIGFIQNLPPELIHSFKATLSEVKEADILLHVIDAADPAIERKMDVVHAILQDLGCLPSAIIYVFSKADLISPSQKKELAKRYHSFHPIFVSSASTEGLEELKNRISRLVVQASRL